MDVNTTASAFLGILWFVAAMAIVWAALRRRARINALPPTDAMIVLQLVNGAVLLGGLAMLTIGVYNLLTKL